MRYFVVINKNVKLRPNLFSSIAGNDDVRPAVSCNISSMNPNSHKSSTSTIAMSANGAQVNLAQMFMYTYPWNRFDFVSDCESFW